MSILGRESRRERSSAQLSSATLDNCLLTFAGEHHLIRLPSPLSRKRFKRPALGHPIYQTYRGVVLNQQEIRKFTHRHM